MINIESGSKTVGEKQVTYSVRKSKSDNKEIDRTIVSEKVTKEPGKFTTIKGGKHFANNDDFKNSALYEYANDILAAFNSNDTEKIYNSFYPEILTSAKVTKDQFIKDNFYKQSIKGDLRLPFDANKTYSDSEASKALETYLSTTPLMIGNENLLVFKLRTTEGNQISIAYSSSKKSYYYINYETEFIRAVDTSDKVSKSGKDYTVSLKQVFYLDTCQSPEFKGECMMTKTSGFVYENGQYKSFDDVNVFASIIFKDGSTKSISEKDIKVENISHILVSYNYSFGADPIEYKVTKFSKYFDIPIIVDLSENQQ